MFGGYKTYIISGLITLVTLARSMGWISAEIAETIIGLLLGGGIATLRSGISTDTAKVKEKVDETKNIALDTNAAVKDVVVVAEVQATTAEDAAEAVRALKEIKEENRLMLLKMPVARKR